MKRKETRPGALGASVVEKKLNEMLGTHRRASDPVNPAHYQGDYVMRIIEDFKLGFEVGNVVKYALRAGKKPDDSELEDLKKALWYLNRKITSLGKLA